MKDETMSLTNMFLGRMLVRAAILISILASACRGDGPDAATEEGSPGEAAIQAGAERLAPNSLRNAYFGETHIHTSWSLDAFANNVRTVPDDAYRFAKGEAIDHVSGDRIQLKSGPLDFIALTEHAEYMGIAMKAADPQSAVAATEIGRALVDPDPAMSSATFRRVVATAAAADPIPELVDPAIQRSLWQELINIAERYNEPGVFTAFIAYEWSSIPNFSNLHRNVIFRGSEVPEIPFSLFDSERPEDLWSYMEQARREGSDVLAIPHNGNVSNGLMYDLVDSDGNPIDAVYARRRMENEPINEVIQVKGQSEAHPLLSPNDEWADFELYETKIGSTERAEPEGGFAREAYLNGLLMEEDRGVNPYKFGMIGASDIHNSATSVEEDNYTGKIGTEDGTPEARLNPEGVLPVLDMSAAGLAGVWAEENTRASIFDAMKRKETFATSGPRMRVRFFGGWSFTRADVSAADMVRRGYDGGATMGGDLPLRPDDASAPAFMIWAARDASSAPLQRLQIIKGWVENGQAREQVYDVACSDGGVPDPTTHRCPDNGATVDLGTCAISDNVGDAELSTLWIDPDFDPSQRAFYYVRVLENPVCRWSTWDAIRTGVEPPAEKPATIQERALSSPIWYTPSRGE